MLEVKAGIGCHGLSSVMRLSARTTSFLMRAVIGDFGLFALGYEAVVVFRQSGGLKREAVKGGEVKGGAHAGASAPDITFGRFVCRCRRASGASPASRLAALPVQEPSSGRADGHGHRGNQADARNGEQEFDPCVGAPGQL